MEPQIETYNIQRIHRRYLRKPTITSKICRSIPEDDPRIKGYKFISSRSSKKESKTECYQDATTSKDETEVKNIHTLNKIGIKPTKEIKTEEDVHKEPTNNQYVENQHVERRNSMKKFKEKIKKEIIEEPEINAIKIEEHVTPIETLFQDSRKRLRSLIDKNQHMSTACDISNNEINNQIPLTESVSMVHHPQPIISPLAAIGVPSATFEQGLMLLCEDVISKKMAELKNAVQPETPFQLELRQLRAELALTKGSINNDAIQESLDKLKSIEDRYSYQQKLIQAEKQKNALHKIHTENIFLPNQLGSLLFSATSKSPIRPLRSRTKSPLRSYRSRTRSPLRFRKKSPISRSKSPLRPYRSRTRSPLRLSRKSTLPRSKSRSPLVRLRSPYIRRSRSRTPPSCSPYSRRKSPGLSRPPHKPRVPIRTRSFERLPLKSEHTCRSPRKSREASPSIRPRSPIRRRSRSLRKSRSPIRRRSRSLRKTRSPIRRSRSIRKSRSPVRRRSRSPFRRRSKTPFRRRPRSPIRRRSKTPFRRRSKTPFRRISRSPIRKRSRSLIRRKSRSPIGKRSRSRLGKKSISRQSPMCEKIALCISPQTQPIEITEKDKYDFSISPLSLTADDLSLSDSSLSISDAPEEDMRVKLNRQRTPKSPERVINVLRSSPKPVDHRSTNLPEMNNLDTDTQEVIRVHIRNDNFDKKKDYSAEVTSTTTVSEEANICSLDEISPENLVESTETVGFKGHLQTETHRMKKKERHKSRHRKLVKPFGVPKLSMVPKVVREKKKKIVNSEEATSTTHIDSKSPRNVPYQMQAIPPLITPSSPLIPYPEILKRLQSYQQLDKECSELLQMVSNSYNNHYRVDWQEYVKINNLLAIRGQSNTDVYVVPDEAKLMILHNFHRTQGHSQHLCATVTEHRITRVFYWKTLARDVVQYIKNCEVCLNHQQHQGGSFYYQNLHHPVVDGDELDGIYSYDESQHQFGEDRPIFNQMYPYSKYNN